MNTLRIGARRPAPARPGHRRPVIIAIVLLAVPIGFELLFAIGEVLGGDPSGVMHAVLAVPLLALAVAAVRWPARVGAILVVVGVAVALAYLVLVSGSSLRIGTVVIVEAVLLLPVLAGILLIAGSRPARPPSGVD